MDTNELTAKYISEDKDRLKMALHVYEAMDTVRNYLVEGIFKAAGECVVSKLDGVVMNCREQDIYFWTEETGVFGVFASAYARPKRGRSKRDRYFVAGVYADDANPIKVQGDEIRGRIETNADWGTWSVGESFSSSTEICFAFSHHEHGGKWHEDNFLRGAILHHEEIVGAVAELLVRIYRGMCPPFGLVGGGQSSGQ